MYSHHGKRGTSFIVIALRELKPCSSHTIFFLLVLILIRLYQDPMDVETWVERERIITKNLILETKL